MKKETLSIIFLAIVFASCQKEVIETVVVAKQPVCIEQKTNPAGRTYATNSLTEYNCTNKHCGIVSLSTKNYWVYEDSLFNDGVFVSVKKDTLRYNKTFISKSDSLTWWKSDKYIGLPQMLYANDSSFFSASAQIFSPANTVVNKSYGLFAGDSLNYNTSIDDIRANGRSSKLSATTNVPAGKFSNTILFEKSAAYYGTDQIIFKPGIGVIKYTQLRTPVGEIEDKLQKVSTLIAYHLE